jgi:hypothetical protein
MPAITITPPAAIADDTLITYSVLRAMVTGMVAEINAESVTGSMIVSLPFSKLRSGALPFGEVLQSGNYAVNGSGEATAGWALKGDGSFDSPGLKMRPDGTVFIGSGSNKFQADTDGTFKFAQNGLGLRILPTGTIVIGGETAATAPTVIYPSGKIVTGWQEDRADMIDLGSISGLVGPPIISPDGGVFDTTLSVSLTNRTAWATMYYTDDGTTPDDSSTLYTGSPIVISATKTIKAIAYKFGLVSSVSSKTFTKNGTPGDAVSNPAFSPVAGTYSPSGGGQAIVITCPTAGATIRYTIDGTAPTSAGAGTVIASGNSVTLTPGTTVLKAIAYKGGSTDSSVVSSTYIVTSGGTGSGTMVATPASAITSGTEGLSTISVSLTCATSGATIYWRRWNGATYTSWTAGTTTTIPLNQFIEVKGTKAGLLDSDILTVENYA